MKLLRLVPVVVSMLLLGATALVQPVAPVRPVVTDYFGTKVVDPYRWMEAGGVEFDSYLRAQNAYTRSKLDTLPQRSKLIEAMKASVADSGPSARLGFIATAAARIFLTRLPESGQYPALFVREAGVERLLFDPNTLAETQRGAILLLSPAPDGKHVAIGVAGGGSEASFIHIIDADTGKDEVDNTKPFVTDAINWRDDASFYYGRFDVIVDARHRNELFHRVGTSMDRDDVLMAGDQLDNALKRPADSAVITAIPPHWKIAEVEEGTDTGDEAVFVAPLYSPDNATTPWRKIAGPEDLVSAVAASGDTLYGLTSKDAPKRSIFRTTLDRPSPLDTVVPQSNALLTDIATFHKRLYVSDRGGSAAHLRVFDAAMTELPIDLPELNSVGVPTGTETSTTLLIDGSTFSDPRRIYTVDPNSGAIADSGLTPKAPANYATIAVTNTFAKSADGTMVPLTVIARNDIKRDGMAPVILLGYGSYGADPFEPPFPAPFLGLVDSGITFAVAHVRGGGELGPSWYFAGKGPNKFHTIDDFIACGRQLIADRWTTSKRLAAMGGSAGGITVGRAMTREPGLFAAVVSEVGISDALRFENTPNGKGNIPEFGTTATEAGFHALYDMSPYAHVVNGTPYPAMLLTTGLNDPRVAPWQVAKFQARVQAASTSGKPVLLRVDEHAGHGFGDSADAKYAELADIASFVLWQEGVDLK
jgi:prolyl oligopeptidase